MFVIVYSRYSICIVCSSYSIVYKNFFSYICVLATAGSVLVCVSFMVDNMYSVCYIVYVFVLYK